MSHQDQERAAADEFDRWAESGRGETMARGHREVTGPLLDRWSLGPADSVLDVGCGNGWAVRWMLERGAGQGAGVDISPGMVELARKGPGRFEVASGQRLPFDDATFSHVLSVESLYYYPDPAAALREWARVTRAGGQLGVMIELFAENRGSAVWADVLDVEVHLWSEERWADAARAAGWRDVETFRILHTSPLKAEADFTVSPYWPSYRHYLDYRKAGALGMVGVR